MCSFTTNEVFDHLPYKQPLNEQNSALGKKIRFSSIGNFHICQNLRKSSVNSSKIEISLSLQFMEIDIRMVRIVVYSRCESYKSIEMHELCNFTQT